MSDSAGEHLSPSDIGDSIEGDTPITAPETPDPDAGGSRRDKQQAPFGFGLELEDEATVDVKPSISHEAAEQDRLERVLGPKPGPPDVTGLLLQVRQAGI